MIQKLSSTLLFNQLPGFRCRNGCNLIEFVYPDDESRLTCLDVVDPCETRIWTHKKSSQLFERTNQ